MKLVKKQVPITKEFILGRVSEYDVYRAFFGDFTLNRICKNHLRGEKKASFMIGTKSGHVTHVDFVDKYWKGDCFNLVQQIYNCDYIASLHVIAQKFGLVASEVDPVRIDWTQPKIIEPKSTLIQVTARKFNKRELDYWADFYQGEEDLKRENIYAISKAYIDRARVRVYEHSMSFAYHYPEIDKFKLYCPEDPEVNGVSWKWRTNCDFDYIEHLDKIQGCKYAFISKSKKDTMVLRKALETDCLITTQSENPACFSEEVIKRLKNNSEEQVTIFDGDDPGKRNSMYLTENYGFKHCNVSDYYVRKGVKDFADMARVYGIRKVTKHFKTKNYI